MDAHSANQRLMSHQYPSGQTSQDHLYQPYRDDKKPVAMRDPNTITVKRSVAFGVGGVVVLLLLAAAGLGAGLGISQRDLRNANNELSKAQAILATATAAPATPSTTLPTSTSSTSPTPTVKSDVQCPKVNGTVYTSTSSGQRFLRLCGIDYGPSEAVDIGSVRVRNLDACAEACANEPDCTGAGWGVIEGDTGPFHSCWMKTNLTEPHKAPDTWGFAMLVVDEDGEEEGLSSRTSTVQAEKTSTTQAEKTSTAQAEKTSTAQAEETWTAQAEGTWTF